MPLVSAIEISTYNWTDGVNNLTVTGSNEISITYPTGFIEKSIAKSSDLTYELKVSPLNTTIEGNYTIKINDENFTISYTKPAINIIQKETKEKKTSYPFGLDKTEIILVGLIIIIIFIILTILVAIAEKQRKSRT